MVPKNLGLIIPFAYPGAIAGPIGHGNFAVIDDGTGERITYWDVPGVKQPTPDEVMAFEAAWRASMLPAEVAKRERKAVAARVVAKSDPVLAIVLKALEAVHAEIKAIKEGKPRPSKSLAEWQAQILADFVDNG